MEGDGGGLGTEGDVKEGWRGQRGTWDRRDFYRLDFYCRTNSGTDSISID
jgi:hypothetical protein